MSDGAPLDPPITLTDDTLGRLRASVHPPDYDRRKLRRSIVHVGVGGFHRAHLATYVDELCRAGHTDWSIVGAGVLADDAAMAAALGPQNCLYTLIARGRHETEVQVIGSIVEYVHASPEADALIASIADPATQVVSLTVTEGGYPIDDTTGGYLLDSPTGGEGSAFGTLAAGLRRRRDEHGRPLTIISCDNIIGNGSVTRTATLGEAERFDTSLASWIESTVAFPNSMSTGSHRPPPTPTGDGSRTRWGSTTAGRW